MSKHLLTLAALLAISLPMASAETCDGIVWGSTGVSVISTPTGSITPLLCEPAGPVLNYSADDDTHEVQCSIPEIIQVLLRIVELQEARITVLEDKVTALEGTKATLQHHDKPEPKPPVHYHGKA